MVRRQPRHVQLREAIRDGIVSGRLPVGGKLPTRTELACEFGVGVATVQRAVDDLVRDGFLHARPNTGTFVSQASPHLTAIALVIPTGQVESRYFAALRLAARALQRRRGLRFVEYRTSRETGQRAEHERLSADVIAHRLAGVVFVFAPDALADTPAVTHPGMPRVICGASDPVDTMPAVGVDMGSFLRRALTFLADRRCRRVAHLEIVPPQGRGTELPAALAKLGADVRPYWLQAIPEGRRLDTAANIVHLLMQLQGDRRPDGLVVHDDNLVEAVTAGLLQAGVRVPGDLEVVAHTNFPAVTPSVLPISRLGFEGLAQLECCLAVLAAQRRGHTPPANQLLPAVFEGELRAGNTAARRQH